jgi:hypothetical protein
MKNFPVSALSQKLEKLLLLKDVLEFTHDKQKLNSYVKTPVLGIILFLYVAGSNSA